MTIITVTKLLSHTKLGISKPKSEVLHHPLL